MTTKDFQIPTGPNEVPVVLVIPYPLTEAQYSWILKWLEAMKDALIVSKD